MGVIGARSSQILRPCMLQGNLTEVGAKRTRDFDLPKRVYRKNGAFWYVSADNAWSRLAPLDSYAGMLTALGALLKAGDPVNTVELLWARYQPEVLTKLAKKTRTNRRNDMKWPLQVFGKMDPDLIQPHHVWNYWRKRGETEQARHEIRALSALLTYGRQCGAVTHENPCFDLGLPGAKPRTLYVTDEMFFTVRDLAPSMIGHAMDIAWCAGLDEGTIIKLERRNVVATGLEFDRGKTDKPQLIEGEDLVTILQAALRERPQLRRFVICRRDGKAFAPNGFQTAWQRLMTKAMKAGLKTRFHFHDLRAKSGSDAASDKEAQDRLGHADDRVTKRHYRRLPQRSVALRILDKR